MKKFTVWTLLASLLSLCIWVTLAQNVFPDSAEIIVKETILEWEATNLWITMMKDGSKMSDYKGTIWLSLLDENFIPLKSDEYILPANWLYEFLPQDSWSKEFQKWLEIKKEWIFYITVEDLDDPEWNILWRQIIKVEKNLNSEWIITVDVLWTVKSMFLRSLWNPNALIYTWNCLFGAYILLFTVIILSVIWRFLIRFIYKTIKTIQKNKNNKEILLKKGDLKGIFLEEKSILSVLRYPIIWIILVWISWLQISLLFYFFNVYYEKNWGVIRENLSVQESFVLWMWSRYSLLIFIIAWWFIWLSFWNKMVRNIWIFIYVMWILFILFWFFLDSWFIININ